MLKFDPDAAANSAKRRTKFAAAMKKRWKLGSAEISEAESLSAYFDATEHKVWLAGVKAEISTSIVQCRGYGVDSPQTVLLVTAHVGGEAFSVVALPPYTLDIAGSVADSILHALEKRPYPA